MKLAVLCAALAAFAAAQVTATVEGVVVNKVTGAGIGGVTLWFWSSGTNSYKAVTDDARTFHLSGLTEGDYSSSVQKTGYTNPQSDPLDPLQDPPKRHIAASAEPARYRFELIPPAVLRGRVIGTDGNPARADVELAPGMRVSTSADGSYAFENLIPGSYMLLARPKLTEHASVKGDVRMEVVPTYYPSALDRSLAESITVRAGAELDGYEIRLQSAEVHRVRGIVLDPDGKPAAKAKVQLHAKVAESTGLTITGFTGKGFFFPSGKLRQEGKRTNSPSQRRQMGCSSSLRSAWASGQLKRLRTGFAMRSGNEISSDLALPRSGWSTRTRTT